MLHLTDLHLDAAENEVRAHFFETVSEYPADVILIGGDIADGATSLLYLQHFAELGKKVYFILGNHDFYGASIDVQKQKAKALAAQEKNLTYLTYSEPVAISKQTCLMGHDGWADAREGDFLLSRVCIRDYVEIDELKSRSPVELKEYLHELADEATAVCEKKLLQALDEYHKVIFLTHAPPFREACLFQGKVTDDVWAPHFVSSVMGKMLRRVMSQFPQNECSVLAGHSHHEAKVQILENLSIEVQESTLGVPEFHALLV